MLPDCGDIAFTFKFDIFLSYVMKNDGGTNSNLPLSSIFIVLSTPTEKFSDTEIDIEPLFTFMLRPV